MSIVVRAAHAEDVSALTELYLDLFTVQYQGRPDIFREPRRDDPNESAELERYLLSLLSASDSALLVAQYEGRIVGFVQAALRKIGDSGSVPFRRPCIECWVQHLAVRPDARRKGVGRALDEGVAAWARERGATLLGLQAWEFNAAADRFYLELGYRPRSQHIYREI